VAIEDIERRAGDEILTTFGELAYRAHLVGFDAQAGIFFGRIHQAAHGLEIGFRFDQRQRRQGDLLAGIGEHGGDFDPVVETHLVAA